MKIYKERFISGRQLWLLVFWPLLWPFGFLAKPTTFVDCLEASSNIVYVYFGRFTCKLICANPWLSEVGLLQWTLVDGQSLWHILLLFATRWVSLYVCSSYLRAHYRNSESMLGQLATFSLDHVHCLCCQRNHRKACAFNILQLNDW